MAPGPGESPVARPPALAFAALAGTLLVGALLVSHPGLAHDPPHVALEVRANDNQATGEYWFTTNETGDTPNPALDLPAGAHVAITFVNTQTEGTADHNLHLGGPVDEKTDIIPPGETRTLDVRVPWDADAFSYWCDPHRAAGMRGDVDPGEGGNTAPDLAVTSPEAGAEVQGAVTVEGDTLDGEGDPVTVEVRLPGSGDWKEASGSSGWSLTWDTTALEDGNHTVEVRATDRHGFAAEVNRTVNVVNDRDRPPALSVAAPPAEAQVEAGEVVLEGSASDPDGDLDRVEVQAPPEAGTWRPADGAGDWSFTWNASRAGTGNHTLRVRAVDAAGLSATVEHPLEVVEEGADRSPRLTLSHPPDGAEVEGETRVAGDATDPDGDPVTVEVQVPGSRGWREADGPDGEGAWELAWDTAALEPGTYTVAARALAGGEQVRQEAEVEVPEDAGASLSFASPQEGEAVRPPVKAVVSAEGLEDVETVRVRFVGQEAFREASPLGDGRWQAEVSADDLPPGEAELAAVAGDDGEGLRASLPVRLVEPRAAQGPALEVTSPPPERAEDLVTVRGRIPADSVRSPPVSVELRVDGDLVDLEETGPGRFEVAWNAHGAAPGVRNVTVQAFEGPAASAPASFAVRVGSQAEAAGAGGPLPAPGPGAVAAALAGVAAAAGRGRW